MHRRFSGSMSELQPIATCVVWICLWESLGCCAYRKQVCDLVWGDLMSPLHCTSLCMKNHRINFWVWTRANGGMLYYVYSNLSLRDSVSTCLQQTPNAKKVSRSALGLCRLPEKSRHLCVLGEWCLFAVSAPLLASAPSVFKAVRVTPALVCGAEHGAYGHTTVSGANTRFLFHCC